MDSKENQPSSETLAKALKKWAPYIKDTKPPTDGEVLAWLRSVEPDPDSIPDWMLRQVFPPGHPAFRKRKQ